MISIVAPFLEIQFYFSRFTGNDGIAHVFRHLTAHGASCEGTVLLKSGANIREQRFSLVDDPPDDVERNVADDREVEMLLADTNTRVLQISIRNPIYLRWTPVSILTQLSIPPEAMKHDEHPIGLWLDGSAFFCPPGELPEKARRLGKPMLEAFRLMTSSLKPDYAVITSEYGMETPCMLRDDPRTLAFEDFYLSRSFLGQEALDAVRANAPGAYHEQTEFGQLTCSSEWIAPDKRFLSCEARDALSTLTGRLIATKATAKCKRGYL